MASYELPELPYGYDALEPAIVEQIMCLRHDKHHNTYVANLTAATGSATSNRRRRSFHEERRGASIG